MAVSTYDELVTEIGDWLQRTDLTSKIPTFIRLFEARMNRRLRSPDMEQTFSFTTVAGTDTYTLNSRVRELRELYLTTDGTEDNPLNYTLVGETIVFDEAPTAAFDVYYSAYSTLPALGAGQSSNWLLADHPDLYLGGSLFYAYEYLRDEAAAAKYADAVELALLEVEREANEKRLPAGPLRMNPPVAE